MTQLVMLFAGPPVHVGVRSLDADSLRHVQVSCRVGPAEWARQLRRVDGERQDIGSNHLESLLRSLVYLKPEFKHPTK